MKIPTDGPLVKLIECVDKLRYQLNRHPDPKALGPAPNTSGRRDITYWSNSISEFEIPLLIAANEILPLVDPSDSDGIPVKIASALFSHHADATCAMNSLCEEAKWPLGARPAARRLCREYARLGALTAHKEDRLIDSEVYEIKTAHGIAVPS